MKMKVRHPLEILCDRGRFFISRYSNVIHQDIKLSGFFETREAVERALAVWKQAEQLEREIATHN